MATEIRKSSELENIIDHLVKFHSVGKSEIYTSLGLTLHEFSNARRYGSVGKKAKMIADIRENFAKQMLDFDNPTNAGIVALIENENKSINRNERDLLKEQIDFYKKENARLREENDKLLNKLLEKI
jgi:hypothetical protein